jgi:hypothetical protein
MREKLITKLGILLLAAIFLLSMASYSTAQGKKKKPGGDDRSAELYKVTISINDTLNEKNVPGLENADMINDSTDPPQFPLPDLNFFPIFCQDSYSSQGYFYAEKQGGKNDLLKIESEGSATPGPDDDPIGGDLDMWVKMGSTSPSIILEGCPFQDGCHLENKYSKIIIRFLTSQDGEGLDPDIVIHLWIDYEDVPADEIKKGRKKYVRGMRLRTLMPYDEGDYLLPFSTNLFPKDGLGVGGTFWTDVIGAFVLLHDGMACPDGIEGEDFLQVLENFNIRLFIERVR